MNRVRLLLAFLLLLPLATVFATPEPKYEYGSEYAIWIHDAPAKLKVEKEVELIRDLINAPDPVTVKMEAGARGPKADPPDSKPSKISIEFGGYASVAMSGDTIRCPRS